MGKDRRDETGKEREIIWRGRESSMGGRGLGSLKWRSKARCIMQAVPKISVRRTGLLLVILNRTRALGGRAHLSFRDGKQCFL